MDPTPRSATPTLLRLFLLFLPILTAAATQYQTLIPTSLPSHPLSTPPTFLTESESDTLDFKNSNSTPVTFSLHHLDSLTSPSLTPQQLLTLRLSRDALRVQSLISKSNSSTKPQSFSSSVISGVAQGSGEYFIRFGIGSPPRYFYMVLDTGSDISWLQCKPCAKCYSQTDPIFNPIHSTTYKSIPYSSRLCNMLDFPICNPRTHTCMYQVAYGDGSFTVGHFVTERLTFRGVKIDNVAVGCGHYNEGLFIGAAGLLGLGRGKLSFPTQTGNRFDRTFSYCLVDRYRSDSGKPSSMIFGRTALARNAVYTPLLTNVNAKLQTFYYLDLIGISVGGTRVPRITSALFKMDPTGEGGVIIDSGTYVTRLTRPAYVALRNAFRVGASGLKRTSGVSLFDTCYDLSGTTEVKVPSVELHFRGADVSLPAGNLLIPVDSDGTFCFGFAGMSDGLSIIGNIQQQGFRIVFDLAKNRVGFAPRGCT